MLRLSITPAAALPNALVRRADPENVLEPRLLGASPPCGQHHDPRAPFQAPASLRSAATTANVVHPSIKLHDLEGCLELLLEPLAVLLPTG
jgi:hypothetical protein